MKRVRLRLLACCAAFALFVASLAPAPVNTALAKQPKKDQPPKLFFIVAPDRFHDQLKDYVAHKKASRPIELVSLENVLKSTQGVDDPERLKRFLYDAWRKRRLGYVLLVGDIDVMPVRYMVLDRVTPAAFDYAFYPSDLYYSDLAKHDGSFDDWNARKDGFHAQYFGEVRGEKNKKDPINFDQIDYRPDIAVGRWPVSTAEEVSRVAAKAMAYEKAILDGTHPGLREAALFNVSGWVDARAQLERLSGKLPRGWKADKFFYQDTNAKFKTPPPDEKKVLAVLNKGAGLVVHVGHGSERTWDRCFSIASLKNVNNADRLPVMLSVGCSTCYFAPLPPYEAYVDIHGKEHAGTNKGEVFKAPPPPPAPYQKGRYNPTGLGEQVVKQGANGAVAYIGCNTGGQPCALTLLEGFMVALAKFKQPLIGDCWASAVSYYYDKEGLARLVPTDDWYPPSIFFQAMKYMLFCDPTLPLAGVGEGKE